MHVIPPSACQDLDIAIERARCGEAQSDESDGELSDAVVQKRNAVLQSKIQGLDLLRSSSAPVELPSKTPRPKPRQAYKGSRGASLPEVWDSDQSLEFPDISVLLDSNPATHTHNTPEVKTEPISQPAVTKAWKGKGKASISISRSSMRTRSSTRKLDVDESDNSVIEIDDDKPLWSESAKLSKGKGKERADDVGEDGEGGGRTTDKNSESDLIGASACHLCFTSQQGPVLSKPDSLNVPVRNYLKTMGSSLSHVPGLTRSRKVIIIPLCRHTFS